MPDPHLEDRVCECCGNEPAVQVAAIPGVGMAIAWGQRCVDAGVIPYWACIAGTFTSSESLSDCDEWWVELVESSLIYHGKTVRDLEIDLGKAAANESAYWAEHEGAGEDQVTLDQQWGIEEQQRRANN